VLNFRPPLCSHGSLQTSRNLDLSSLPHLGQSCRGIRLYCLMLREGGGLESILPFFFKRCLLPRKLLTKTRHTTSQTLSRKRRSSVGSTAPRLCPQSPQSFPHRLRRQTAGGAGEAPGSPLERELPHTLPGTVGPLGFLPPFLLHRTSIGGASFRLCTPPAVLRSGPRRRCCGGDRAGGG